MIVAVSKLRFELIGIQSLKEKRAIVKRLIHRTRNKYNVAVAEVAEQDAHRRATIALAALSNDASHANAMVDSAADYMTSTGLAPLMNRSTEIIQVGELQAGAPRLRD